MPDISALRTLTYALAGLLVLAPAYGFNVNQSVSLPADSTSDGASSINGSVSVGTNAVVNGSLSTVNGSIRVADNVRLQDAETVNGAVRFGNDVTATEVNSVNGTIYIGERGNISGEVSVVNGRIHIDPGSTVGGDVSNVNGEIEVEGSAIGGDISTVSGDVLLTGKSVLNGDLIIEKPSGWNWGRERRKPRIVIGPGSIVVGTIKAEQKIELFISDSAEVGGVSGEASMEEAIRFSGAHP